MLYMGIDVGTQGVRCVIADERGAVAAAESVAFARLNIAADGLYEQSPADWRAAAEEAIMSCTAQLKQAGISPEGISGGVPCRISPSGLAGGVSSA